MVFFLSSEGRHSSKGVEQWKQEWQLVIVEN